MLSITRGALAIVANDAPAMTASALDLLARPRQTNSAGRACVLEHYNWDTNLKRMEGFLLSDGGIQ